MCGKSHLVILIFLRDLKYIIKGLFLQANFLNNPFKGCRGLFRLSPICTNLGKPFSVIAKNTYAAQMKTETPPHPLHPHVRATRRRIFPFGFVRGWKPLIFAAGPTEGKVFICERVRFLWPVYVIVNVDYLHVLFYGVSKKPWNYSSLQRGKYMKWLNSHDKALCKYV